MNTTNGSNFQFPTYEYQHVVPLALRVEIQEVYYNEKTTYTKIVNTKLGYHCYQSVGMAHGPRTSRLRSNVYKSPPTGLGCHDVMAAMFGPSNLLGTL